jgi:hypothetical protein
MSLSISRYVIILLEGETLDKLLIMIFFRLRHDGVQPPDLHQRPQSARREDLPHLQRRGPYRLVRGQVLIRNGRNLTPRCKLFPTEVKTLCSPLRSTKEKSVFTPAWGSTSPLDGGQTSHLGLNSLTNPSS